MKHIFQLFFICITLSVSSSSAVFANNIQVQLLQHNISLPIWQLPESTIDFDNAQQKKQFKTLHELFASTPFNALRDSLLVQQQKMSLNDWLLYQVINDYSSQLQQQWNPAFPVEVINWFILNQLNKDARIGWTKKQFALFVKINEEIFEAPIIEEDGSHFINLSAIDRQKKKTKAQAIYLANFTPNPQGDFFSFALSQLPNIPSKNTKKKLLFKYKNQQYAINFTTDANIPLLFKNYPLLHETAYFDVPLSPITKTSLLKELNIILAGFSNEEKLAFLATLSRSAFQYKEDGEFFGFSKPMVADEVFFYPYSDCEDRSALFFNLVKELLPYPQLVIAFPDHISIAVAFPSKHGRPILYNGKKYYICDPTGPANNSEIGTFPPDYKNTPYSILMHWE